MEPESADGVERGIAATLEWAQGNLLCTRCAGSLVREKAGVRCAACAAGFGVRGGILDMQVAGTAGTSYDSASIEPLLAAEQGHFWFAARRMAVARGLRATLGDLGARRLFDVGCGTGNLLRHLAWAGVRVDGACDSSEEALRAARTQVECPLVLVDDGRCPALRPGREMLSLFDVLEHIDDDESALRWAASVLEPGGVLVITVPAHPALFGRVDEAARHRRRYGRRELSEKLGRAGFEVRLLTHIMALVLPLVAAGRFAGRRRAGQEQFRSELRIVPGANEVLRWALALERQLIGHVTLPFGPSLLAVAVRPVEAQRGGTGSHGETRLP